MRSDEISAISTAIPLQCPIDRVILDCTNTENEEVTQEITILPVVKFRMLIKCNTRVTEPEGKWRCPISIKMIFVQYMLKFVWPISDYKCCPIYDTKSVTKNVVQYF